MCREVSHTIGSTSTVSTNDPITYIYINIHKVPRDWFSPIHYTVILAFASKWSFKLDTTEDTGLPSHVADEANDSVHPSRRVYDVSYFNLGGDDRSRLLSSILVSIATGALKPIFCRTVRH